MKGLMLKASLLLAVGGLFVFASPVAANDAVKDISKKACNQIKKTEKAVAGCTDGRNIGGNNGLAQKIVNGILILAGAVAVIFIIVGGISYIASTGDPGRITQAKNTILYAIIGLVITILAIPVSQFVIRIIRGEV